MYERILFLAPGDENRSSLLNLLGDICFQRWKASHIVDCLNYAFYAYKDAVRDDPGNATYLNDLGRVFFSRFEILGDLGDLNGAVSNLEEAVRLTPDGHKDRLLCVNSLGIFLQSRFEQLGDLADLSRSISKLEDAVRLTQDDHPEKLTLLYTLANSLRSRFQRLGDITDLNGSISNLDDCVRLTPNDHPNRPARLGNLGHSLHSRFLQLGNLTDLNESITKLEDAIRLTSDSDPDRPAWLNNLANSLQSRFQRLGDLSDLNESRMMYKDAIELIPDGHPHKVRAVRNLANALFYLFEQTQNRNELVEMIVHYKFAACSVTGPADIRFSAAAHWASVAEMIGDPSLLEAYNVAFNLLPEVAWIGLSVNDRHHRVLEVGEVVRKAARAAISFGEPKKAVEWLEQGRSIIWGQLLNLRSPVDDLNQEYPELAKEFLVVSTKVEETTSQSSERQTQQSLSSVASQAHENAHKREVLLQKIRQLKGFQRFLLPKTISEISPAAAQGPVVFLNVTELSSCDALAILPGNINDVRHIPLHELTPDHVKALVEAFEHLIPCMGRSNIERLDGHREAGAPSPEDQFEEILSELWMRLVKPVLDALAITTPTKTHLPRIWWCPTGPLTFLPIHAAGLYGETDTFGSKLSDFVISSYTPSLAALVQGFRSSSQSEGELQLLAVAQPSAFGQTHIPGTKEEIQRIEECARGKIPVTSLVANDATVARVEEGMMKSAWVHFACHGIQDKSIPTESALLLAGSSQLTLERIIELSLPHANLAFLSACQTATGDKKLQDESVHLAAGMLLAGYRGVIATMWSIIDEDGPQVAKDVYEHLFKTSPPDATRAAEALHLAVQNLRERKGKKKSFFHWVPFIHVGV
ncbi:CHAT domain-containing protein [Mycena galopus ATCC 62051]|nr:CHAT domain-containing protein [Mycena galopus ATCC 62051]